MGVGHIKITKALTFILLPSWQYQNQKIIIIIIKIQTPTCKCIVLQNFFFASRLCTVLILIREIMFCIRVRTPWHSVDAYCDPPRTMWNSPRMNKVGGGENRQELYSHIWNRPEHTFEVTKFTSVFLPPAYDMSSHLLVPLVFGFQALSPLYFSQTHIIKM